MTEKNPKDDKTLGEKISHFVHNIELSAVLTVIGVILLFSTSIIVVLIAPRFVDSSWTDPTTPYQVMMYEVSDPHLYISSSRKGSVDLEFVHHLKENYSLLAFKEGGNIRIIAPQELEKYITRLDEPTLKLTSKLLLLRNPIPSSTAYSTGFNAYEAADRMRKEIQDKWVAEHPNWKKEGLQKIDYQFLELYDPKKTEAFSIAETEGEVQNWIDENYTIIEGKEKQSYHQNAGTLYVKNPKEYRVSIYKFGSGESWHYDPNGIAVKDVSQLKGSALGFLSRKELIEIGEHIFTIEGCWYCHTDQTRTLVQDVVLNGSESFPAPPSSPNEYIYQNVTFMGTRRIGPDLSRVGVKRPSRDWHKGHFWFPKTASPGTIMPAFRHFFDNDPRGTPSSPYGIPNYQFEAIFQYLMTKGTRITPPTQAWWLGKDPIQTIEIIEGRKTLK